MELSQKRSGLELKFFELCCEVCQEAGYRVYDLEWVVGQKTLRVYIHRIESLTATIDDCVVVDRKLSIPLEQDWVPEGLVLEVSSPGLFRQLKAKEHFEQSLNARVALVFYSTKAKTIQNPEMKKVVQQGRLVGQLCAVDNDGMTIQAEGQSLALEFDWIKKVCLEPLLVAEGEKEHKASV